MEEALAGTPIEFGETALAAGFVNGSGGAHDSKTMMLPELGALLSAVPDRASLSDYKRAVVEDNALDKRTAATRAKTFQYLRKLYALDGTVPVFAALRELLALDATAQPLIAVLCATARDPLLRATLPVIFALEAGDVTGPAQLAAAVGAAYPGRFNPSVLHHVGQGSAGVAHASRNQL